ncbi:hypothetical protein F5888DRAFT_1622732, partial [Russula emetica]
PFTTHFPRADIHELLAPDLLHQIIKGTFKDHLVTWVMDYVAAEHGKSHANQILADIDRRIATVPLFTGLRRFPEGRGFKQWTGDDSKALMKVFLPAISGHVPPKMVRAVSAFTEFCYLARRSQIDETTLELIDAAIERFHREREVFIEVGIREDFSLPRQHSLMHYSSLIRLFGVPNGICSSITESKHIEAVKKPWRRSSRNQPLGQMLLTNQRLDKLAAARVDFKSRGMLDHRSILRDVPPLPPPLAPNKDEAVDAPGMTALGDVKLAARPAKRYPKTLDLLTSYVAEPNLPEYIRRFLYDQLYPDADLCGMDAPLEACPTVSSSLQVMVFHSALATYHAPSDLSGIGGMHREWIRATPSWQNGAGRYDCVFIDHDPEVDGFAGLYVARIKLFLSFVIEGEAAGDYPCALVEWFSTFGDSPCEDTGLWSVVPERDERGRRITSLIHIDTILRAAHLIGVAGHDMLPKTLTYNHSLDVFHRFYVNKYIDYHAHETAW